MANHVLYDRLWESDKLAECSRDAAMAYPWIFLVADDHGRFEYRPRRIWTKVFGARADVTLEDVTRWLDEYWRVGLLVRYHLDGDLAYWSGFKGRKPSERRGSDLADPEGIPTLPHTGGDEGAEEGRSEGATGAEAPRQIDARDRSRTDLEQIKSGADIAARAAPPLTPVVVVPIEAGRPWNQRACELWIKFMGEVSKAHGARITNALRPLVTAHDWPTVEPLWIEALEDAVTWDDSGRFTPEVFARAFTARLRKRQGGIRAPPPSAKAVARQVSAEAFIRGGQRDRNGLGAGDGGPRRLTSGSGIDAGDGVDSGSLVPGGSGPPDGR